MYLLPITIAEGAPAGQQSPFGTIVMMVLIFAVMYMILIRPQKRREKERREMISNIKSGCRVLLTSGIIGEIINVKEQTLIVRIADNTKIEVVRGAISKQLEKGEIPTDLDQNN
jgi:preprotein translocase subunit YajC